WLWLLINPLMLLGVYAVVFGVIFQARAPATLDVPFIAWLALAMWPWLAFSDSVLRASESIPQHGALISKIAIKRELLPLTGAVGAFILQILGFVAVLVVVSLTGTEISYRGIPHALLILLELLTLGCGLGLFAAAIRVYLPDWQHLLPTLIMLWFFLTPILYAPEMLPEEIRSLIFVNPLAGLMGELRAALLQGQWMPGLATLAMAPVVLVIFGLGLAFFRRLSPYFEDFL
ncbi:MAG: ABC transporter permease, partial [Wenzhouxiangellaceae bacterium]|nr:ABC transporter permease [Wenzhouxiangellaceae bacterium]